MGRSTIATAGKRAVAFAIATLFVASVVWMASSFSDDSVHAEKANVGRLKVKVKPKKARQQGGQWSVDAGATWHNHKEQIFINPGDYTVEFKDINGWVEPNDKNVTIELFKRTKAKGKYLKEM